MASNRHGRTLRSTVTPLITMKLYARRDCGSLDAKTVLGDEDSSSMLDLADLDTLGDQDYKLDDNDIDLIFENIDKLDRRSQKVLKMRFGLDGYQEYTYKDLGEAEGMSRERARQIELKAIRKLRVLFSTNCLGKIAA